MKTDTVTYFLINNESKLLERFFDNLAYYKTESNWFCIGFRKNIHTICVKIPNRCDFALTDASKRMISDGAKWKHPNFLNF
jgi:hypothetical protein